VQKTGLASILFCGVIAGCAGTPPNQDYLLANTAVEAAKTAQAQQVAPGYYARADELYHRAVSEYEERHYAQARKDFADARYYAEQAENFALLKKAETGDSN
jgi:hypothetical protein